MLVDVIEFISLSVRTFVRGSGFADRWANVPGVGALDTRSITRTAILGSVQ